MKKEKPKTKPITDIKAKDLYPKGPNLMRLVGRTFVECGIRWLYSGFECDRRALTCRILIIPLELAEPETTPKRRRR